MFTPLSVWAYFFPKMSHLSSSGVLFPNNFPKMSPLNVRAYFFPKMSICVTPLRVRAWARMPLVFDIFAILRPPQNRQKSPNFINFDPLWACKNIGGHGRIILVEYGPLGSSWDPSYDHFGVLFLPPYLPSRTHNPHDAMRGEVLRARTCHHVPGRCIDMSSKG